MTKWVGDRERIKAGSKKKIGKIYEVLLSRPMGDWDTLKITVKNTKTGISKNTKFIPKEDAIKFYKEINSVKKIKESFKI